MTEIMNIDMYSPQKSDRFFFDTNIWIYLFYPIGNYKRAIIDKYSEFFHKLIQAEADIFISSLVLSEFFNVWVRAEFRILQEAEPDKYKEFKRDFRNTQLYQDKMREVKFIVKHQIFKLAKRIDDDFSGLKIDKILRDIEKWDFNDKLHLALVKRHNLKFVTNDSDFHSVQDVPIITANHHLLRKK